MAYKSPFKKPIKITSDGDFVKQRSELFKKMGDTKSLAWTIHYQRRILELEKAYRKFAWKRVVQKELGGWSPNKGSLASYATSKGKNFDIIKTKIDKDVNRWKTISPSFKHPLKFHEERILNKHLRKQRIIRQQKIIKGIQKKFASSEEIKERLYERQVDIETDSNNPDRTKYEEYDEILEKFHTDREFKLHRNAARAFELSGYGRQAAAVWALKEYNKLSAEEREKIGLGEFKEIMDEALFKGLTRDDTQYPSKDAPLKDRIIYVKGRKIRIAPLTRTPGKPFVPPYAKKKKS